ncbi:MAG: phosphatase PAP2 family protein [Bacteroidaceae bacterium]|nr:phosphatase PAP2 family protein [Bacteroidaceae bacterium]
MKFLLKLLLVEVLGLFCTLGLQAQSETYFTADELPDPLVWIPGPPDSTSIAFGYDVNQYMWGKEQRKNAERAEMAIRDAVYGTNTIAQEYSDAFGITISAEGTPAIYHVLDKGCKTIDLICQEIKKFYMRRRPFMVFKEHTLVPGDEEHLSKNGSYPSGHTILGWSGTLILTEINPDAADELSDRGYEYGQSRVIAGYHWQSDVNAGRVLTSAAFARLHTNKEYLDDMAAARKEFESLVAK